MFKNQHIIAIYQLIKMIECHARAVY